MFSNSWPQNMTSSTHSLPTTKQSVTAGLVVVESQYDYSYRGVNGRVISIQEGERFLLIRKTNADWWQVRRLAVGVKAKPLYVPATYVVEVPVNTLQSPHTSSQTAVGPNNKMLMACASLNPCSQIQYSGM